MGQRPFLAFATLEDTAKQFLRTFAVQEMCLIRGAFVGEPGGYRDAVDATVDAWLEGAADPASDDYLLYGEVLFNNASAQDANSCARCHTPGFSFGATSEAATADLLETWPRLAESGILTGWQPGAGHVGPDLAGVEAHFSTSKRQSEFIRTGSEVGIGFGNARTGSGGMPGYGGRVDDLDVIGTVERSQLLTPEQIDAIVAYERSL